MTLPYPPESRELPLAEMERARELADSTKAGGMAMDFDTAQGYVEILERANRMPLSPLLEGEPSIVGMEPSEVYHLAEALDVAMTFDPDESRRWAAASLAVEIRDSLVYLPRKEAEARAAILSASLGITNDSKLTPTEQLVERYFSKDKDMQLFTIAAIQERVRTSK